MGIQPSVLNVLSLYSISRPTFVFCFYPCLALMSVEEIMPRLPHDLAEQLCAALLVTLIHSGSESDKQDEWSLQGELFAPKLSKLQSNSIILHLTEGFGRREPADKIRAILKQLEDDSAELKDQTRSNLHHMSRQQSTATQRMSQVSHTINIKHA